MHGSWKVYFKNGHAKVPFLPRAMVREAEEENRSLLIGLRKAALLAKEKARRPCKVTDGSPNTVEIRYECGPRVDFVMAAFVELLRANLPVEIQEEKALMLI